MGRLTWEDEKGNWGIKGIDWNQVPRNLYGAFCKLHDYEKTGLEPQQISDRIDVDIKTCGTCNWNGLDQELDEMVCMNPDSEYTGASAMYHRNCKCWKPISKIK